MTSSAPDRLAGARATAEEASQRALDHAIPFPFSSPSSNLAQDGEIRDVRDDAADKLPSGLVIE